MKTLFKKILPRRIITILWVLRNYIFDEYSLESYSQEGEDRILARIFEKHGKGFYVDVGALHPRRFSNTYYFYKRGWSGINIDATPGSMIAFNRERTRDINVEKAIGKEAKEMTFFIYNEPALNTFDKELVLSREKRKNYHAANYVIEERNIRTTTLAQVLKENMPEGQKINFLSVDVEGLDLEVLQSNDWRLLRPEYILIEVLQKDFEEILQDPVYKYLDECGYKVLAKTVNTLIFEDCALAKEHQYV